MRNLTSEIRAIDDAEVDSALQVGEQAPEFKVKNIVLTGTLSILKTAKVWAPD
jgi:hypothetical protein